MASGRGEANHAREAGDDARIAADRLWPVLLDRLTDEEPDKRTEALQARVMSRTAFRDSVLRDIRWLLNTSNAEDHIDFTGYDPARRSTINFGLAALSGRRASDVNRVELEAEIRRAIVEFEPRLLPDTLEVRVVSARDSLDLHNVLALEIRAQLWSVPYPLEMLLRSDIDLETGHVVLREESRGAAAA